MSRVPDVVLVGVGKVLGGLSVVMGASGILIVLLEGDTELLIEEFVLNLGLLGIGFGLMTWMVVPRQPRNSAVWALCGAAVVSGIYAASLRWTTTGGRPNRTWMHSPIASTRSAAHSRPRPEPSFGSGPPSRSTAPCWRRYDQDP